MGVLVIFIIVFWRIKFTKLINYNLPFRNCYPGYLSRNYSSILLLYRMRDVKDK